MRLNLNEKEYFLTEHGFDLSIPIRSGTENVNAWWCNPVSIEPVVTDSFIGDVNLGGTVNFRNILINPHGNGTHTECVGHISKEAYTINQCLKEFHFYARIISVQPKEFWNENYKQTDQIIDEELIQNEISNWKDEKVMIIRTQENSEAKIKRQYSGTNPAYFTKGAIELINNLGVQHLMVDLPSVDRELDEGALICHKTFWNYPDNPMTEKTISELLFIPNHVADGQYLIQIQIMSIESDASPCKIIAHQIHQK
jgi:kynurenine formamidase